MSSPLAPEHAQRLRSAEARWLQGARDRLRRPRAERGAVSGSGPTPESPENPETEETDR